MKPINRWLLPLYLLAAGVTLVGCDSSDDNGNDDSTQTPGNGSQISCSGQVDLVTSGSGLNSQADYQDLHFFGVQNQLCALNPQTGDLLLVDEEPNHETLEPLVTVFTGGTETEDLGIAGVAYRKDQEVRFASADPDAPQTTKKLAKVSEGTIDFLILAPDREDWERSSLAYRTDNARWHAVQLDGSDPWSFAEEVVPLGPINNPQTGKLDYWIAQKISALDSKTYLIDPSGTEIELDSAITSTFLTPTYIEQLDNGDLILAGQPSSNSTPFYLYDYEEESLNSIGSLNFSIAGFTPRFTSDGEAVFLAGQNNNNQAVVYKISATEIQNLYQANEDNTAPTFIVTTDNYLAWNWNQEADEDTGTAEYKVYVSDLDGENRQEALHETATGSSGTSSSLTGQFDDTFFFNLIEMSPDGQQLTTTNKAYAVPADQPDQATSIDNASWQLSISPANTSIASGFLPPKDVSHLILTQHDAGTERVLGATSQQPTSTVDLGNLPDNPLNPGVPLTLFSATPATGLGPYRLFSTADSIWIVDMRHAESLARVVQDTNDIPNIRTSAGF